MPIVSNSRNSYSIWFSEAWFHKACLDLSQIGTNKNVMLTSTLQYIFTSHVLEILNSYVLGINWPLRKTIWEGLIDTVSQLPTLTCETNINVKHG